MKRRKKKMKRNKIGSMFLVSVLALAGVGISYAGFTDYITVYGTVNTATVDINILDYSGTDVFKVWAIGEAAQPPANELYIWRGFIRDRPTIADIEGMFPGCGVILVASAWAMPCTAGIDDEVDIHYNNIFPCIDFIGDFIFHYEGSIPGRISQIIFGYGNAPPYFYGSGDDLTAYLTVKFFECTGDDTDGDNIPDDNWVKGAEILDPLGYQLHFCDCIWVDVIIHLPQDNELQGLSGSFGGFIEVIQWTDLCPP
jgi:hypothetical protein